jgi:hypothetical protein
VCPKLYPVDCPDLTTDAHSRMGCCASIPTRYRLEGGWAMAQIATITDTVAYLLDELRQEFSMSAARSTSASTPKNISTQS